MLGQEKLPARIALRSPMTENVCKKCGKPFLAERAGSVTSFFFSTITANATMPIAAAAIAITAATAVAAIAVKAIAVKAIATKLALAAPNRQRTKPLSAMLTIKFARIAENQGQQKNGRAPSLRFSLRS